MKLELGFVRRLAWMVCVLALAVTGRAWGQTSTAGLNGASVSVSEGEGTLVLTTYHQESTDAPIRAENLPANLVRLAFHDHIWAESLNGLPIDTVSDTMTISSIAVPDLGETLLDRVKSLVLWDENGEKLGETTGATRTASASVKLKSDKATYVMAHSTTFTFEKPPTVECWGKTYYIEFIPADGYTGGINIPIFQNSDSSRTDKDASQVHVTDDPSATPYLEITGAASFDVVTANLPAAGEYSLDAILDEAERLHKANHTGETSHDLDTYNHLILVRTTAQGAILEMDRPLSKAEIVFASGTVPSTYDDDSTIATRAATVRFRANSAFTGALSLRDYFVTTNETTTVTTGMVRMEYVDDKDVVQQVIPTSVFSPYTFAQKCDLELASYPAKTPAEGEAADAHWFYRNAFTIPSERTLRLVTCTEGGEGTEDDHLEYLPNIAFESASARLDLAFASAAHAEHMMAVVIGQVIDHSSGTLDLHSAAFTAATRPAAGGGTEENVISMGNEVGAVYGMPTEQTIEVRNNLTINNSFILANGANTKADVIQHSGTTTIGRTSTDTTTYNDVLRFGRGDPTDPTAAGAARANYMLKGGTLNVPGTLLFSKRVQSARFTVGDGEGEAANATIGTLLSTPKDPDDATNPGLDESSAASVTGIATVEILSDGMLTLEDDLDFTPPDRSFFYMEGGTLISTKANAEFTFGQDVNLGGGLRLRGDTVNTIGGTGLTIDAVTGDGDLRLAGTVKIGELRDFRGRVDVQSLLGEDPSAVIETITGANSVIIFGNLGVNGTMGVETILNLAKTSDYRGSIGFAADVYEQIDIESVEIETLRHAIRVDNGQELIIRLDQLADTIVAWPTPINTDDPPRLTIIEAGAYGGRITLPLIPEGVKVEFRYYKDDGTTEKHTDGTWTRIPDESGVTELLTWEEPHVAGKGTWIDVEFETVLTDGTLSGNSRNTGWMQLGDKNGVLKGIEQDGDSYGRLLDEATTTDDSQYFTDTSNPEGRGVKLYVRPYLDTNNGNSKWWLEYPEVWSAAIRMSPPNKEKKVIVAIGSLLHSNNTKQILVLATGTSPTELVLWHVKKNDNTDTINNETGATGADGYADSMVAVAKAIIADRPDVMHVLSITCNGKQLIVYLDGRELVKYALPADFPGFGTGLQVGQLLDDGSNEDNIRNNLGGVGEYYETDSSGNTVTRYDDRDGGVVDYIRFYKGELTPVAMTALSEDSPPIDRATRYLRTLTAETGNLWVDTTNKPWERQTWEPLDGNEAGTNWDWVIEKNADGTTKGYAEPTEGAEVRLLCTGNHTLQVNVEKKEGEGFLTRDRFYSLFTVTPSTNATQSVSLKLEPIGGGLTASKDPDTTHAWMDDKVDGDYQYGTLRFQGGAGDLVHPPLAMEAYETTNHALWVRSHYDENELSSMITLGTPTDPDEGIGDPERATGTGSFLSSSRTWTQTRTISITREDTLKVEAVPYAVKLAATASVCALQAQSPIVVSAASSSGVTTQTRTVTRTFTQTRTVTVEGRGQFSPPDDNDENWSDWSPAAYKDPDAEDGLADGWTDWNENDASAAWGDETTGAGTLVPNTLEMRADYTLVRGKSDQESVVQVLCGPVSGAGLTVGNTEGVAASQVSNHVWVPKFQEGFKWHLSDVTESYYGAENNEDGTKNGLIVQLMQVPGRLYLDLSKQELVVDGSGKALFSLQDWYRYGYEGTAASATDSGEEPRPITVEGDPSAAASDFNMAVAFQIRVNRQGVEATEADVNGVEPLTLVLDAIKPDIGVFRVDLPEDADDEAPVPSLILETGTTTNNVPALLTVTGQLITRARLVDLGENPAIRIADEALIHGHTTGTYAFQDRIIPHMLKDYTVANLEIHGTKNEFQDSIELHDTNLILAEGAVLRQTNPDAHLWMKGMTLGKDSTFQFEARGADSEANGIVFLERVRLQGNAILKGGGAETTTDDASQAGHFTAPGFTAEVSPCVLTMDSDKVDDDTLNRWICNTASFEVEATDAEGNPTNKGFGLTKTGAGIAAFRDINAPSLSGPVRVEAGTLRVGGKAQASDALLHDGHLAHAIGHHGLHVAEGATLAPNLLTPTEYVVACLERGQTLSGIGTVNGNIRLCSGAKVDGEKGIGMRVGSFVHDSSESSDIEVTLPTTVANGDTLFYLLNEDAQSDMRRRFKAMNGAVRLDVVGEQAPANGTSSDWQARYFLHTPDLPTPDSDDVTDKTVTNAYDAAVKKTLITYYQLYGVSQISKALGYTKGNTYVLNAAEMGAAFDRFANVWTFDRAANDADAATAALDSENFYVAYEFGISRLTLREIKGTQYVVVEVSVQNTLKNHFGDVEGSGSLADIKPTTRVVITCTLPDGTEEVIEDALELTGFEAETLDPPTAATRTIGKRYYAFPYTSERFPTGTTTITVSAEPPATTTQQ